MAASARPAWQRPVVILAAALAIRLVTLVPARHSPPYSDEAAYDVIARSLVAGRGFAFADGKLTSWRPPLWPGVLAGIYRVAGPSPAAARVVQVGLGTLLVGLVILLAAARRPEDDRVPALAGWFATLSPTLIFYSHGLWSETLFGLCLGLALWGLLRARGGPWGWVALAGVGFGLAALCRGSTLLLVPAAAVWLAWHDRRERRPDAWRALLLVLLTALVVAPWTLRNYRVHGGLIVVDSNSGVNLFYGNNARTPLLRAWEVIELKPLPWPVVPPGSGEVVLQKEATRQALLYIAARPGRFVLATLIKVVDLWGLTRNLAGGVQAGLYGHAPRAAVMAAALVDGLAGLALLVLGVLGLGLTRERAPAELQILVMVALTLAYGVAYGHSRYLFGALLLLYGYAAEAWLRRRTWREDLAALPPARRRITLVVISLLVLSFVYGAAQEVLLKLLGRRPAAPAHLVP